jgi:hypothetical protein
MTTDRPDPHDELRQLVAAKLAEHHVADPDRVAELVMSLFATVDERWDRVDTTALGAARHSWVRRWEQDRFDGPPPPVRVG